MSSSDKLECQAAQKLQAQNCQKQFTANKLCYEDLEYTWGLGNVMIFTDRASQRAGPDVYLLFLCLKEAEWLLWVLKS